MPDQIMDGTGSRYKVKVDKYNRLRSSCVSVDHMGWHSDVLEVAYSFHMHQTVSAANTFETTGYLTYEGDYKLNIAEIVVCSEESPTAGSAFMFSINPTGLSGGTALTTLNMNLDSNNTFDYTSMHDNDASNAISFATEGTHFYCMRLQGYTTYFFTFHEALLMSKNDTLLIQGKSENAGKLLRATIFCFEDNDKE